MSTPSSLVCSPGPHPNISGSSGLAQTPHSQVGVSQFSPVNIHIRLNSHHAHSVGGLLQGQLHSSLRGHPAALALSPAPVLGTPSQERSVHSDGSTLSSSLLISPCDLISLPEPGLHLPASSPALLFQACQSGRPGDQAPEASLRDGKWGFSRGPQTEQGSAANRPPSSPSAPVHLAELCLYPQSLGAETHTVMMSTFSEG